MWFFTVFSEMKSFAGDVSVVEPLSDESEHLHLAIGEPGRRHLRLLVGRLAHRGELGQELARHRGADPRLPRPHRADRVGDLLDRDLLQQVAGGARLDRLVQVGFVVADREHEDLHMRERTLDLTGRFDARLLGHADVHEDHVGHELLGADHHLGTVRGLADELEIGLLVEHHLQPATEQGMVVAHQHPQLLRAGLDLVGHPRSSFHARRSRRASGRILRDPHPRSVERGDVRGGHGSGARGARPRDPGRSRRPCPPREHGTSCGGRSPRPRPDGSRPDSGSSRPMTSTSRRASLGSMRSRRESLCSVTCRRR